MSCASPRFDHVVLNVADVERSLAWYTGELGLEPIHVEEWRRGERFFPSVRVDEGTIIDLIGLPRSGENLDHFCLVVEPTDFDALKASRRFEVADGPAIRFGRAATAPPSTSATRTTTSSSCGTTDAAPSPLVEGGRSATSQRPHSGTTGEGPA